MTFDPFNAPRFGQSSQDPFGGPVGRRPSNLPGGDVFAPASAAQGQSLADRNITPRIEDEKISKTSACATTYKACMTRFRSRWSTQRES